MSAGNLMIVQGGGSTAVFNASLSSAIAEAICVKKIGRIFGARFGVKGLVNGEIVELGQMTAAELRLLRNSPGALLGSSRFKPDTNDLDRMVNNLRRLDVRFLIFMGGNGTMHGAELVRRHCHDAGFEVQIIGVPKTVDNDIVATDRCPGYASAARYVAQSTRDLGMDIRSLPQPVTILEVIGRSIGWVAAASTLAKVEEADAPHLVHLPETPFDEEEFLTRIDGIVTKLGWAVAVVSEGIRNPDGSLVYELSDPTQLDPLKRPMTGGVGQYLANMVGAKLKIRCRSEKPGLLARVSMAHVSLQDQQDAELVGRIGVRALVSGETDKMVALRPLNDPGETGCDLVPLSMIAGVERTVTKEWLTNSPLAVGPAFQDYLRPLVGELYRYSPALPPAIPGIGAY
ncbi:MAG: diphosphate--fructose-6-phosphate 1-phosphotransferase [Terracidiphilus sp.]|nr:diphosphate--fructose-6-phosphate 1-phosphotransferase [Terracidiphilus sp.]